MVSIKYKMGYGAYMPTEKRKFKINQNFKEEYINTTFLFKGLGRKYLFIGVSQIL